jgi:hypothetical protein
MADVTGAPQRSSTLTRPDVAITLRTLILWPPVPIFDKWVRFRAPPVGMCVGTAVAPIIVRCDIDALRNDRHH